MSVEIFVASLKLQKNLKHKESYNINTTLIKDLLLLLCLPLLFLTGSPFINQERFAGGLLCQDVHVASTPSPTPAFMLFGKPVMLGFLSGRSATKIYIYISDFELGFIVFMLNFPSF